jgi:hypothetical protein
LFDVEQLDDLDTPILVIAHGIGAEVARALIAAIDGIEVPADRRTGRSLPHVEVSDPAVSPDRRASAAPVDPDPPRAA